MLRYLIAIVTVVVVIGQVVIGENGALSVLGYAWRGGGRIGQVNVARGAGEEREIGLVGAARRRNVHVAHAVPVLCRGVVQ